MVNTESTKNCYVTRNRVNTPVIGSLQDVDLSVSIRVAEYSACCEATSGAGIFPIIHLRIMKFAGTRQPSE